MPSRARADRAPSLLRRTPAVPARSTQTPPRRRHGHSRASGPDALRHRQGAVRDARVARAGRQRTADGPIAPGRPHAIGSSARPPPSGEPELAARRTTGRCGGCEALPAGVAQKGRLALAGIATGAAAGASVARLSWREVLPETGRGAPAGASGPRRAPSASGVPTGRPLENHSARPGAGVGAAPTAPRSRSPTVRTTT
jgi:hypothetical protein